MKILKSIVACVVVLSSCASQIPQIEIPVNYTDKGLVTSSVVKDFELLSFSNEKDAIIKGVSKLCQIDNRYLILDKESNQIMLFEKNGKFVSSTKKMIGRGKNEYIKILDVNIDTLDNRIYLYTETPNKVFIFDSNMELLESIPMDIFTLEFTIFGDYAYMYCIDPSDVHIRKLLRYDKHHIGVSPEEIISATDIVPGVETFGSTLTNNGGCYFCNPFKNQISVINMDGSVNNLTLDFQNYWFGKANHNERFPNDFFKQNDHKIWMMKNVCSSDSLMIFTTNTEKIFKVNKTKNICNSYNFLYNDLVPGISNFMVPTSGFYGKIAYELNISSLMELKEKVEKGEAKVNNPRVLKMLQDLTIESNSIVVLFQIK